MPLQCAETANDYFGLWGIEMNIRIEKSKTYQTFEGFGASGAWWAQCVGGWSMIDPESCMPVRERISQLLFSKREGIGLRTYRYNIGAGSAQSGKGNIENPLRRTETFETSPGNYDFSQDANAVRMLRQAVKDGADEVVFFVNSPPERLTKNGKSHCDKAFLPKENLAKENYAAFARYCLDVTEHFVREGIPIRYLSPINEPLWVWTGGQEGCHYRPKSAGRVLKVFAEEIEKREALRNVRLSGLENGDIRWYNKSYTRNLFKYSSVRSRTDSVDLHSYFLPFAPGPFFQNRPAYLKRFRRWMDRHYPGVPVRMSEWTHMQGGRDKSMSSALVMANVIYEDISVLNVTAWQHWIAVSEVDYCDGLIYINLSDQSFEMTKRYYVTGNFSKFIPFGAKRVQIEADDKSLKLLAFVKDEKTIVIAINDTETDKNVLLPVQSGKTCTVIVTDEFRDLEEYRSDSAALTLPARSVTTVLF